jgi:hypothetical protein
MVFREMGWNALLSPFFSPVESAKSSEITSEIARKSGPPERVAKVSITHGILRRTGGIAVDFLRSPR